MSGGSDASAPFNARLAILLAMAMFVLVVPRVAGLLGVGNALRMRRLPDPKPSNESSETGIL
ncbi:hypothetical protein [Leifsonia aquatica]|uniref:hypothetical protein n=1 Tax=Leifsonia aquatica TaxID=144185 RepID=UPI0028A8A419|nr:hypothetical protein [Leifsonia aquatica]